MLHDRMNNFKINKLVLSNTPAWLMEWVQVSDDEMSYTWYKIPKVFHIKRNQILRLM